MTYPDELEQELFNPYLNPQEQLERSSLIIAAHQGEPANLQECWKVACKEMLSTREAMKRLGLPEGIPMMWSLDGYLPDPSMHYLGGVMCGGLAFTCHAGELQVLSTNPALGNLSINSPTDLKHALQQSIRGQPECWHSVHDTLPLIEKWEELRYYRPLPSRKRGLKPKDALIGSLLLSILMCITVILNQQLTLLAAILLMVLLLPLLFLTSPTQDPPEDPEKRIAITKQASDKALESWLLEGGAAPAPTAHDIAQVFRSVDD